MKKRENTYLSYIKIVNNLKRELFWADKFMENRRANKRNYFQSLGLQKILIRAALGIKIFR